MVAGMLNRFSKGRKYSDKNIWMAVFAGPSDNLIDLIYSYDLQERDQRHSCDLVRALLVEENSDDIYLGPMLIQILDRLLESPAG